MKTVFEHSQSNILIIPQALFAIKDVTVIKQAGNSAIFYKNLEQDLVDIAFYTNTPCLIYVSNGLEVLTNSSGETVTLRAGSAIFLPQGSKLRSDFVRKAESLKAFLVFFDDDIIARYLGRTGVPPNPIVPGYDYCLVEDHGELADFFASIRREITTPSYLDVKLLELLHLIHWSDRENRLPSLLSARKRRPPRQNLAHILETLDTYQLTVSDLAHLSGRSLSSFQRDFKAIYGMPPKRWIHERKLSRARKLLMAGETPVTEVALTMGYENTSSFIKAFKARYGVTPRKIKSPE
ncbi:MAG: helix-turn-helix transcriptional regulator [Pseudomonadales bacterium]|nr:helix-turn-helix transcriptional regulator [Pseudomonadales bacterium]